MIHFIVGSTGAGKTTYAKQLADKRDAVRFAIDEWMHTLFFPDLQQEISFDWAMQRIERCEAQIWSIAQEILSRNQEVILEISLSTQALRQKQYTQAKTLYADYQIHYLDVDKEIRRQRVQERNQYKTDTFSFEVTDEQFDFVEAMFEPLTVEERKQAIICNS